MVFCPYQLTCFILNAQQSRSLLNTPQTLCQREVSRRNFDTFLTLQSFRSNAPTHHKRVDLKPWAPHLQQPQARSATLSSASQPSSPSSSSSFSQVFGIKSARPLRASKRIKGLSSRTCLPLSGVGQVPAFDASRRSIFRSSRRRE